MFFALVLGLQALEKNTEPNGSTERSKGGGDLVNFPEVFCENLKKDGYARTRIFI